MRGRKHPKDRLTRMISLRIPEYHYQRALEAAQREGISFSSWVRRLISFALSERLIARVPPVQPTQFLMTVNSASMTTPTMVARCPHMSIGGLGITGMTCWSCGDVPAVAA